MKKDTSVQPRFATNWDDPNQTVAEAITRFLGHVRTEFATKPELAIATAYFNASGFSLIADELENAPRVRLLLGAEPDRDVLADLSPSAEQKARMNSALTSHEGWLAHERDLLGFTPEETDNALRLVRWLRSLDEEALNKVEVRKYNKGFLHGKAFIANHPTMPTVLAGSSNFTYAGLAKNAELMVGVQDEHRVEYVLDWFNTFWEMSEPFDLASLYEMRWQEHSPWLVFLRMLWERYGDHIDDERFVDTMLHLTPFQADGVSRAMRLMDEIGGVLVSDEVGLGKTFIAGEIIKQISEKERQKVLILSPAALRDGMWNPFLKQYDFSRQIEVKSYAELRRDADPENHRNLEAYEDFMQLLDSYGLVVVDEAHNLRNDSAAQSKALTKLLSGPNPKRVLLLTATPVNNSLTDLENLIKYFVPDDSAFAKVGIPSVSRFIKRAQSLDPQSLSPKHLFDLMDLVAVRRTRTFVKKFYPDATIKDGAGNDVQIVFPEAKLYELEYHLHPAGLELIEEVVYALEIPANQSLMTSYVDRRDDDRRLMMARYTPSAYSKTEALEKYQVTNAGLLRSALLKRLESSPIALENTLKVLIASHEAFLSALDEGFVMVGRALQEWGNSDFEDIDQLVEKLGDKASRLIQNVSEYRLDELRSDVTADLHILKKLLTKANIARSKSDPKIERLLEGLTELATKSQNVSRDGVSSQDRRKVIVFSTYTDTVLDIHAQVTRAIDNASKDSPLALYKNRIAPAMSGRGGGDDFQSKVIEGFSPKTSNRDASYDSFDLLITTDVLSEGVNLQQAGQIINYDLPWNPMRIVQRHGRIDRIGSEHRFVHLGLFFPDKALDKLLHLEETLQRKIAYAVAAIGETKVMPGQISSIEVNLADKMQIDSEVSEHIAGIKKLKALDASILESGSGAVSGEEFRKRLFKTFEEDTFLKSSVLSLPYGSGSGFVSTLEDVQGYVFCVRIKNEQKPWLLHVPTDENWNLIRDEQGNPVIQNDTLPALLVADPGSANTLRSLDDVAYKSAFKAWSAAQSWAHSEWQKMTDPLAFRPEVPAAFRDAINLVFQNPAKWPVSEVEDLLARLNSRPAVTVRNSVRRVLDTSESHAEKATQIRNLIMEAGLQPRKDVAALPPATLAEVRLVTWLAVTSNQGEM